MTNKYCNHMEPASVGRVIPAYNAPNMIRGINSHIKYKLFYRYAKPELPFKFKQKTSSASLEKNARTKINKKPYEIFQITSVIEKIIFAVRCQHS